MPTPAPFFSIITPTHNVQFLAEAYASLLAQTDAPAWEWVILCNGKITTFDVHKALGFGDDGVPAPDHIRILRAPEDAGTRIGALKQHAFMQGEGNWLIEFDHDDVLEPWALRDLHFAAVNASPSVGFLYSDFADFGPGTTYAGNMAAWLQTGWQFQADSVTGGPDAVAVPIAFAANATTLSRILWAPNHVRVWRRDVYHDLKGHDPALELCDDHELMVRTYLRAGMQYIPRVLYRYRVHDGNTWQPRAHDIAKLSADIGANNIEALLLREGALTGRPCIDLGAECAPREGWEGCDIVAGPTIKHVHDLTVTPWPWADNSVQAFRANDLLEHLPDKAATMREIWRCLAPGGWLLSETPSTDGRGAFMDPTHVSYWNENAFWYWIRDAQAHYIRNRDIRFSVSELATYFPSAWHKQHNISYVRARLWKPGPGLPRNAI